MLFRYTLLLFIAGYPTLEPLPPLIKCPRRIQVFAVLDPHVLPVDDVLERLGVVNPLERTQAVSDWHHAESLNVQVSVHAGRVVSEYSVHYLEELLYALIQAQIFTSLDKEMIVFFVRTMHCQTFGSTDRA